MAKSKNHTNHNQNRKAHRNGIKKVKKHKYRSLLGVHPTFRRNRKYCERGMMRKKLKDAKAASAGVGGNQMEE